MNNYRNKRILCYCEMNSLTGFGHYSRIQILLNIIKFKNVDVITTNYNYGKKFFKKYNVIKKKNLFNFITRNIEKYDYLIMDPPYYPNRNLDYKKFSNRFKNIFENKKKTFKTIWLTDETNPTPKYCDLLINDYPEAKKFHTYYKKYCRKIKLITGIYAFLFQKEILKKKTKIKKKHILIAFGGDDPKSLVKKYFSFFSKLNFKKVFITNKKTFKILKKFHRRNNVIIQKKEPKEKFLSILSKSIFYISTPSNIMFEAWSLGISGNVIPVQSRQQKMGKVFEKLNIVNLLPFYNDLTFKKLRLKIKTNFYNNKKSFTFDKKKAIETQKKISFFFKGQV